jgi:hypothetical protein
MDAYGSGYLSPRLLGTKGSIYQHRHKRSLTEALGRRHGQINNPVKQRQSKSLDFHARSKLARVSVAFARTSWIGELSSGYNFV